MRRTEPRARVSYIVYQDLNDPLNVFLARADEVVAGTFRMVAGPFERRDEAQNAVDKLRRGR